MRPWKGLCTCAVLLLAAGASPIQAAWCNVFQVCCPHRRPAVSHYYSPAPSYYGGSCCPQPCPQTTCCQQYQARYYYEPVTTYQTKTYYEPVTSYRTSYYYEPVTSYRTSCYYDPCSCSYIQKSTPVVSYQLKAQTCPVQTWVERCASVPVTSYRQSFYWEPVNPCPSPCTTTQPGVSITPPAGGPSQPGVTVYPSGSPDQGFRQPPPGGSGSGSGSDNPTSGSPGVRLERVVALPSPNVEGQVVRTDYSPRPDTEVLFIHADRKDVEQRATTNKDGEFRATLAAGRWDVYVKERGGPAVLQKRIEVSEKSQMMTLTSK